MLIKGFAVDPIEIALLQFLMHNYDLHSLHPAFMSEWHPVIKNVLSLWQEAGPGGNVDIPLIASHLATFHYIEVSAVKVRDQVTHDGLLVEMLWLWEPLPEAFEAAKAHFPAVVDLSLVSTPNFRAQMLTWAVSGAPFLATGTRDISMTTTPCIWEGGLLLLLLLLMLPVA
ncbi:hypothetical protein C8R44DRAFT_737213 [Mycena epipterygia]|nr:hypothetical protein C8R44DRAFT_737213 [Mycena epipterygia]